MKFKKIFLLMMIGLFVSSCGNNTGEKKVSDTDPVEKEELLWDEVMEIHDQVMPKVSNINRMSRQLREYFADAAQLDAGTEEQIKRTVTQLDGAEEAMWAWMNNLKQLERLREETNHEGIMEYLEGEKQKITKVRDEMLAAIEAGENLKKQLAIE